MEASDVVADPVIMRTIVLAVGLVAVGSWASIADAQVEPDVTALQMKACTLIADEAARVRCYDHAMSRPASPSPLVTVPQPGGSGPAALVTIPQSSIAVTSQPPPAARPQPSTTASSVAPSIAIPQSSIAATTPSAAIPQSAAGTSEPPSLAAPITPKSGTFFDKIIGSISPSTGPAEETWQVKADKLQLEQASQLLGTLTSADGKSTLVLKCNTNSTEAYVTTSSFLGWESLRVLYRINGNPVTERRWAASARGNEAVSDNAIEFINALTDNGTLMVTVFDYNEMKHDITFNLGSVSGLRSRISSVCRRPTGSSTAVR